MALRLARAFTGRKRVVKFAAHFHGWHEGLEIGVRAPYTNEPEAGQLEEVTDLVTVCPPDDIEAVRTELASNDIAALILEPTGGHFGTIPMNGDFVAALREETLKTDTLLIFDEVVTGFRVSPGGAQAHLGVTPDLTSLAKILAGGLPGGAVVGRADFLEYLATKPDPEVNRHTKIAPSRHLQRQPYFRRRRMRHALLAGRRPSHERGKRAGPKAESRDERDSRARGRGLEGVWRIQRLENFL